MSPLFTPIQETSEMDGIWVNSTPVDLTINQLPGCFTSLPVRVHKRDDMANAHSLAAIQDWASALGSDADIKIGQTFSPVGNVSSFIWAESSVEKLPVLAWTMQAAYIYDDVTETEAPQVEGTSDRKSTMKRLLSQRVFNSPEMDTEAGTLFTRSFKSWADEGHVPQAKNLDTFDNYIAFRLDNSGVKCFWDWIVFSSDYTLTPAEWDSVSDTLEIASTVYILTNDYFSWHRECYYECENVVNVIDVYMRTEGLSEDDSRRKTKQGILRYEQIYLEALSNIMGEDSISKHVKRFLQSVAVSLGGYHYWASACLRFNFWKYPGLSPDQTFMY